MPSPSAAELQAMYDKLMGRAPAAPAGSSAMTAPYMAETMNIPQAAAVDSEPNQPGQAAQPSQALSMAPRQPQVKNATTQVMKSGASRTQGIMFDPELLKERNDRVEADPQFAAQKQGIAELENLRNLDLKRPMNENLAPLLSLASMWSRNPKAGEMLKAYKQPDDASDEMKRAFTFASKLQDERGNLTKSAGEVAKNLMAGKETTSSSNDLTKLAMVMLGGAGGKNGGMPAGADRYVLDTINKNVTTPLNERAEQLNNLAGALDSGEYGQIMPVLSIISKNIGADKGALSEGDINRTLTRTLGMDFAKALAYATSNPSEKIDPKVIAPLKELVGIAKKNLNSRYSSALKQYKGQFAASPTYSQLPLDNMFKESEGNLKVFQDQQDAANGGGWTPEKQKRLEELRAKVGKK